MEQVKCTGAEECPHAEKSAELAVEKVFAILGVDVNVPKDVEQFRADLRFGAAMRRAADRGQIIMWTAIGTVVIGSCMAALWVGIVANIRGK